MTYMWIPVFLRLQPCSFWPLVGWRLLENNGSPFGTLLQEKWKEITPVCPAAKNEFHKQWGIPEFLKYHSMSINDIPGHKHQNKWLESVRNLWAPIWVSWKFRCTPEEHQQIPSAAAFDMWPFALMSGQVWDPNSVSTVQIAPPMAAMPSASRRAKGAAEPSIHQLCPVSILYCIGIFLVQYWHGTLW